MRFSPRILRVGGLAALLLMSVSAVAEAAPDRTPPTGTVKINNGAATTTSRTVTLTLTAQDNPGGSGMVGGKAGMQVRNDNPRTWPANRYERFQPTKPWTLLAGNGPKIVYVKFRDKQGNVMRQPVRATIQLVPAPPPDTTPPTGTLRINSGATVTATPTVTLTLVFTDTGSGLGLGAQMQFSNGGAAWSTPEPYAPTKPWTLTSGDGAKTVSAKVKDVAGNWSPVVTATIRLETPPPPDTTPPTISNLRATDVTPTTATLRWTTDEPATSQVEYGLTTAYGSQTPRDPALLTTHVVTLTGLTASATYHARALSDDAANNHAASADLTVTTAAPPDTTPPTGTVTINGGAAYTRTATATVTVSATDDSGTVAQMRFSHDQATWTAPEPYATTKPWTLTAGDGPKIVSAQFADSAGNWSVVASDGITLDATPPTGTLTINGGAATTTTRDVALTLTATDTGSGLGAGAQMQFSNDGAAWSPPEPYAPTKPWTLTSGDGPKTISAKLQDVAGTWAAPVTATIRLDTAPPPDTTPPSAPGQPTEGTPDEAYDADGSYTIAWAAATDAESGIAVYELQEQVNGGAWTILTSPLTTTSYPVTGRLHNTRYRYRARAQNGAVLWGNWSLESDGILVDTSAPTTMVSGVDGVWHSTPVTVTLAAADTGSGVATTAYSTDGTTPPTTPYTGPFTLSTERSYTIRYASRDLAGNTELVQTAPQQVKIDTTPPTGTLTINEGATYTKDLTVTLTLTATDTGGSGMGSGAQMRFSNDAATWSAWEAYATPKTWTLSAGDGAKTVSVQLQDVAGNPSTAAITATIILDTSAPAAPSQPTEGTPDEDYDADGAYTVAWGAVPTAVAYELQEQVGAGGWTTLTGTATTSSYAVTGRLHNTRYAYRARAQNAAGTWGPWSPASDGVLVDTTVPTTPVVTDDGAVTASATQLHATWTAADPESAIAEYQVALGTTAGGTDVVPWTSTGTTPEVTKTGLALTSGTTYYVAVKARNGAGTWSAVGISDGITVDTTAPTTPVVTDDGVYTVATDRLHATWTPSAGAVEYQVAIGTTVGGTTIVNWTSVGTATEMTKTGLTLTHGTTYYVAVKARNAAGTWSPPGTSDGITVDTTAPTTPTVTDDGAYTTSTTQLHAMWASRDLDSGLAEYQYQMRQDTTTGPIVVDWTSTGATAGVTKTGLTLTPGTTYYVAVKARNGAGTWSAVGTSDGIRVDTSAPTAPGLPTEGEPDTDYDADGAYTVTWPAATDPESGIAAYELQEKVGPSGSWTTLSATLTTPSHAVTGRLHNTRYAYRARAQNAAGTWGSWSPESDGLRVDTTPPDRPTVLDDGAWTSSTVLLHVNWNARDPESVLTGAQYAIGTTAGGTDVVGWTPLVPMTPDVTITGLTLGHGKTYYVSIKARNGAGLWSEAGTTDGIVVDKNPPVISAVSPADGSRYTDGDSVTVTATASDADNDPLEYQFLVDGVVKRAWSATASWAWATAGTLKEHTLTVQVRDTFGRQAQAQSTVYGFRQPVEPPP